MKKTTKITIGMIALLIVLKSQIGNYEPEESILTPEKITYGKGIDDDSFNECITMKIVNGYPSRAYKSENVYLLIDKETKEVSEYLCVTSKGNSKNWFESIILKKDDDITEVFEIPGGDLICYYYSEINGKGLDYLNYLKEKSDIIRLKDLELYIDSEPLKEWYSLSEIKELEPRIVEAFVKIDLATKRLIRK